jgi:hypothetical protein
LDRLKICELRDEIEEIWWGDFSGYVVDSDHDVKIKRIQTLPYLYHFNPLTKFFPEKIDASEHRS